MWFFSKSEKGLVPETREQKTASEILMESLQSEFGALLTRIEPRLGRTRFGTTPEHDGSTHVEVSNDDTFHYIATERGEEVFHHTTQDKDELVYWLVKDVAWTMALDYEVRNRVKGRDFRRLLFAKWVELLSRLNSGWADRCQKEIDEILSRHPFDDRLCPN